MNLDEWWWLWLSQMYIHTAEKEESDAIERAEKKAQAPSQRDDE